MKIKGRIPVDRHFVCSGGFIDNHGDILTAKHCTEDADLITIVTADNQYYRGTIVATSTLQDLAVIHIDRLNTPYFVFASSVSQGEEISTLGSPLALTGTQSWGRVARLSGDLLFMDESVLPGNSGGVVFNKNEELVGCAVSVAIVGFGVTHLAQAQSLDTVVFFIRSIRKQLDEYSFPIFRALDK
jgi:S1-C subfamily serine protease